MTAQQPVSAAFPLAVGDEVALFTATGKRGVIVRLDLPYAIVRQLDGSREEVWFWGNAVVCAQTA